ncbi:hypothetical protein CBL_20641, partial [Carabus blaptoides fortunei]
MSEAMQVPIAHKLNGSNYKLWKFQVDALLRGKRLSKYVRDTVAIDATSAQVDAFSIKDGKAMAILISSLESDEAQNVLTCMTAKEIYDKLGSIYAKRSEVSVMTLYEEYFALKLVEDDSNFKTVWYNIKGRDLNNVLSRLRREEDQLNKNIVADSAAFAVQKKRIPIAEQKTITKCHNCGGSED